MSQSQVRNVNEPEAKSFSEEVKIKFRRHPIYNLYYGSKCGKYIMSKEKLLMMVTNIKMDI